MNHSISPAPVKRLFNYLPWLHFTGACQVFLLITLYAAVHSQLGHEISAGESPGFAWIGKHLYLLVWLAAGYLIAVGWLQHSWIRSNDNHYAAALKITAVSQLLSLGPLALAVFKGWIAIIYGAGFLLLISIFMQGFTVLWYQQYIHKGFPHRWPQGGSGIFPFLVLVFCFNAIVARLDPAWQRLSEHIHLNSDIDIFLGQFVPMALAGTTGVWFGIVTLAMLALSALFQGKFDSNNFLSGFCFFLPFFLLSGCYAALTLSALTYAIEWQIDGLGLGAAVFVLAVVLCAAGSALLSHAHSRLLNYLPANQKRSAAGLVSISAGVLLIYPLFRLITSKPYRKALWIYLLLATVMACGFAGYLLLYGDLFNPWFTAFSYLKSILLKILTLVTAGALVLALEEAFPAEKRQRPGSGKRWALLIFIFFLGLLPFGMLERYSTAKAALLQFSDLARVDAAYARELAGFFKLSRWVRLGQNPDSNQHPHPWPQPWKLQRTHPSQLPENFNLMVIVADALRGDAFHSAGYHRNLTPFLDQWAKEDAISFRRAYSQGGGSFAAFPFLVAGRSRFDLYGPDLYRENLFLKIARAEGIRHFMVMQGFGPRSIYPPDHPVVELAIPQADDDRRTASADEVFHSAQEALRRLPAGERFLCFLHLMDVHNDLWKKPDGIDFGSSPRDLYDSNLSYLDGALKRFLSWLKANSLYEQTVILFTSDHGEQFWEHGASLHGNTLYEEEIRIPVILVVHGIQKRFEDVPIIAADIAPTIAELAGYSIDPPYDDPHMGISLVPLIFKGDTAPYLKRDIVGRASFKRRYFFFRNWQWKLIYFAELDLVQLFDLHNDPLEKQNLVEVKPELAAELEQQLLGYLEKVEGKTYRPLLTRFLSNANSPAAVRDR